MGSPDCNDRTGTTSWLTLNFASSRGGPLSTLICKLSDVYVPSRIPQCRYVQIVDNPPNLFKTCDTRFRGQSTWRNMFGIRYAVVSTVSSFKAALCSVFNHLRTAVYYAYVLRTQQYLGTEKIQQ